MLRPCISVGSEAERFVPQRSSAEGEGASAVTVSLQAVGINGVGLQSSEPHLLIGSRTRAEREALLPIGIYHLPLIFIVRPPGDGSGIGRYILQHRSPLQVSREAGEGEEYEK